MGSAAFRPLTSHNDGASHPSHSTRLPSLSQIGLKLPHPHLIIDQDSPTNHYPISQGKSSHKSLQQQTSNQLYVDVESCELESNSAFPGSVRKSAPARGPTDAVYKCEVSGCGKSFKNKSTWTRHGLLHGSSVYGCPFCTDESYKYTRPDYLQRYGCYSSGS